MMQASSGRNFVANMPSPIGNLFIVTDDQSINGLYFDCSKHAAVIERLVEVSLDRYPVLLKARQQLMEYFSGRRKVFDLPLKPQGTVFQLKAWKQLQAIPYGKTIAYSEQAARVGDIKKARAVGIANGRNPISIIVPCHRVIGADGSLTGYGGGVETKQFLLDLEKKFAA